MHYTSVRLNLLRSCVVLLVLMVSACGKDSNQPVRQQTGGLKLAKIEKDAGSYDSLFYNNDGDLARLHTHIEISATGGYDEYYTFEYNAAGKLVKIKEDAGDTYEYSYVNGQLAAVLHYVNGVKMDFRIFNYTGNKVTSIETYEKPLPAYSGYEYTGLRDFVYYANENLKQESYYTIDPSTGQSRLDFKVEHEAYDDKFNPAELAERFTYLSTITRSLNNITRRTVRNAQSGVVVAQDFAYTYNAQGYPLTSKLTSTVHPYGLVTTYHYY